MFSEQQIQWLYQSETHRGTKAEKRIDSVLMDLSEIDSRYDRNYDQWWSEIGRFEYRGKPDTGYRGKKSIEHHRMTIALAMPERKK